MKTAAGIISSVFHPLFMPLISMVLYLKYMFFMQESPAFYRYVTLVIVLCTLVLPLLSIILLKSSKIISSVHMPSRQERRWPLLLGTAFFFLAYVLIRMVPRAHEVSYLCIAGIITLMACTLINLGYKVSIHMAGIGGLTGMMLALAPGTGLNMVYIMSLLVIVAGLVGFARLQLSAHSGGQVFLGYFTGFFTQFFVLTLIK